ncbi:MAG: hypothetical protein ABSH22_01270 [Tepidisphaeraceae bacterium]|jgi:hypothetical protein
MIQRMAGTLSLIAFATCLLVGLEARNPFTTTVLRGLAAMGTTFVVGLVLGTMAKAMLDENLRMEQEKLKNSTPKSSARDR